MPVRESPATEPAAGGAVPSHRASETAARPDARAAVAEARAGVLDSASALALQRSHGNAAVVRLLARQPQGGAVRPLLDPFAEDQDAEFERIRAERARLGTELSTRMTETLDGRDAILFLSRLRAMNDYEREALSHDANFWTQMRRRLSPMALWSVQLILEYGPRRPTEVNELSAAVHTRDHRRARTLLMGYDSLKRVPGLREAIAAQFERAQADDLRAILVEAQTRAESGERTYREAIYDEGVLKRYTGTRNYELVRLTTQLRVIVRIRLHEDPAKTGGITDAVVSSWEQAIARRWNNKFRLRCGERRLDVWFIPVFVYHDTRAHFQVMVSNDAERAEETHWHALRDADHAAHEFGHMLGNPDEYNLPGSIAEIPAALGLTDAEKRRSSYEGITGTAQPVNTQGYDIANLLGDRYSNQSVRARHAWDVLETFNANLRRAGEDPWTVEMR